MKTTELIGPALDWAVAKCENLPIKKYEETGPWYIERAIIGYSYTPSTDWAQGGPIIEREGIELRINVEGEGELWMADTTYRSVEGPRPLIAAMRCYCASKLGDEVEIPEELL